MKKNVPWQARLFAIIFILVVTFAVATKRAERSAIGSKVETQDPVTGSVTSVTETVQAPTNEHRRITFTVSPRLGNGTNGR